MRSFTVPAISCSRGVRLRAWRAVFCDPTTPLDQAGEGLAFARGIARDSRRGGSLVGSVLITGRAGDAPSGLLSPLGGVTIAIRGGTHAFSTTTDSNGQYALREVPPGRYLLTVSASLDVDPIPPATIQVNGPGACVVHTIVLSRSPW
jgi:Carboxypeptidase regulatory-like domain